MLSCFIHPSVFGQPFWLPTTGDIQLVGWPSMDVHHTGIAVQGDIQAVVYDGDHPGITVFNYATGQQAWMLLSSDGAYDPDVVIDPITGTRILVVYQLNPLYFTSSFVYYEYFEYHTATNTLVQTFPADRVSNAPSLSCESYPNVDVGENGLALVTWQDTLLNQIYVAGFQVGGFSFPIYTTFTNNPYELNDNCYIGNELLRKPDISVKYDTNTQALRANVVFEVIDFTTGVSEIVGANFDFSEYDNQTPVCGSFFTIERVEIARNRVTDPRVSANGWSGAGLFDCNVTWTNWDVNIFPLVMKSRTNVGGIWNPIQSLNEPTVDLSFYPNRRPVTTYSGDFIINAWDYNDLNVWMVRGVEEPLARQLDWMGTLANFDYSVVPFNRNPATHYKHISIDGRYTSGLAHYTFWDPINGLMFAKRSIYSNQSLRRAPEETLISTPAKNQPLKVYPTRFENELWVEGEVSILTITDAMGRAVLFEQEVTAKGLKITGVGTLASGIYYLTVVTPNKNEVFKIMK